MIKLCQLEIAINTLIYMGCWVLAGLVIYITFWQCTRLRCCGGQSYDLKNPPPSQTSQKQQHSISHHHPRRQNDPRYASNPVHVNPPPDYPPEITNVNKNVTDGHLESRGSTECHPNSICSAIELTSLQNSQQRAPPSYHQHSG
ncbi:hypothetical protein MKW98_025407 [Papaver atlanticum]|uniref:Uncharacterized protein n=1 Tax=Papaver atlanticum TaxID=357466 RepID=A0AAD4SD11_9MAGN|nr:hypothetical protein MKW98_025407 [Papaver atlanticum]